MNSHWRETVFGRELMTGWISSWQTAPMSRTTIESLGDFGYQVEPTRADPFDTSASLRAELDSAGTELGGEELIFPVHAVDAAGAVVPIVE